METYVVIFRAKINELDSEYIKTALQLREFAIQQFGCMDFISYTEGRNEISISYWPNEESIKKWKEHSEHILAQEMGRKKWYESYVVQVTKITREYKFNT